MKKGLLYILALLFATLQVFAQTTYTYDNLNRLTKVVYSDGTTISYTFDVLGNRTRKTVTGAHIVEPTSAYVWLSSDGKTLTFCYDDQKSQRDGTTYELNTGSENPAWNPSPQNSSLTSVTAVVFDKAFAEVKPTSTYSWFYYLKNLSDISGLQYLNTTEVTDMYSMFRECKSLKTVDVSKFNTAKVTSMAYMFYNCSGLTNLDVSSFNIANVKNSTEMFSGCSGLTNFSISASMSSLDQRACNGIGSTSKPCSMEAPEGFNFGVDTSGDYFIWKKGYFRVESGVTDISVEKPNQILFIGESANLNYTILPSSATNKNVTWKSSDNTVVKVEQTSSGYTAVAQKVGTATLTVTTVEGGKTAIIKIEVRAHVESINLTTQSLTINRGNTVDLSQYIKSVLPENAYDKSVKWTSSNTSVVSISGSSATAKATGSCRVTATSVDNPQVTASLTITVVAVASGIYVNNPVQTVWVGEDVDLSYYFEPADATSTIKSWTSSDASVVAVSGSNTTSYRAVAQKSGTAVLTVKADNGQTATIQVTVRAHVTSILLSTESVTVNKGSTTDLSQFISAILPEDAYDKSVKWTSSNTSVVSISGSSATAKATGSCRVTATSVDNPQVTASLTITVVAVASGIYVNNPVQTVWVGEDVDLSYYFEPADATSTIKSWTSSDASVVAVSGSNTTSYRAVAQKSGTAVLTVKADNGQTATIQVTVRAHVTSILLSTESVTVNKGSTTDLSQFISAILPEDAYDKSVKWAVTDTSTVVTISQSNSVWQMTANREGSATLKISSVDNPQATAFLLVTVVTDKPHNGDVNNDGDVNQQDLYALVDAYLDNAQATLYTDIDGDGSLSVADITKLVEIINPGSSTQETIVNGHEYVDLGLPSGTLWATCNVGASKPEEFGGRYAWGETETKEKFNWSNYIHCDGTKETCHDIGSNISGTEYDVAFVKWGGPWQMPTSDQLKELKANCRYEWTTLNGVSGGKLTGPNGNSIFIPSTGTSITDGVCWSSSADYDNKSYRMRFEEAIVIMGSYSRDVGYPVRPVITSNNPFENEDLQSIVNNVINNMVSVEGGTFTMGATDGWGYEDERPVHEVTLSPYKISRYEVTQQLWNAVMGSNPSSFIGDDLPVNNVSWNECTEFIQKLNNLTSVVFDDEFCLPTEARWEFAARGGILGKDLEQGNGYQYSGGYNNIENMESYVWCSDNSDGTTHAIGSKKPNELGLYDMSGNVCEYVQDYFSESYSEEAQTDPIGVSEADAHIYRGGSYNRPKWQCRLASRYGAKPDEKLKECGLRLATRAQTIDVEDVTLYPNQPSDITISLTGMKKCIATSFIVELPEGSFKLSNSYLGAGTPLVGCFNDDHVVISKSLDDKTMRVVIYSPSNSVFKGGWVSDGEPQEAEPGGDPNISGGGRHMPSAHLKAKESHEEGTDLFKLNVTAEGMDFGTYQGNIKNVQLTLKDLRLVSLPDIVYQLTLQEDTDIIDINVDAEQNDIWYDLSGRRIIYQPDSKGVYIKNGQKVVVSK